MADLTIFLNEIAADRILRRAFADAPAAVLRARGYDPDEFDLPERMDLDELEMRLQELAGQPAAPEPPAARPDAAAAARRRVRCRLDGGRPAGQRAAAPAGPLSDTRVTPPFAPPPSAESGASAAKPESAALDSEPLKATQESGAPLPAAWFGSYGTAVSRALMAGDNAARLTPETVINTDDRVEVTDPSALPFRWICRLVIKAANGTLWSGTGWFIGPNLIVTAGHCVYMQNQGGWVRQIDVSLYDEKGKLIGPFKAQDASSVTEWVEQGDSENDYGVIVLAPQFSKAPGNFGFGAFADQELQAAIANIAGFPVDKPPATMWGHARRLSQIAPNSLYYEIDTYGGMSGAPVVCWNGRDYIAIGIHNYGDLAGNRATRINAAVFGNLEAWLTEYAS